MGKPAGSFTVALGDDLRASLITAARKAGVSASSLARRSIAQGLAESSGEHRRSSPTPRSGEPTKEVRVTMPQSAAVRLSAAARAAGMTRSAYLSSAALGLAEGSGRGTRVSLPGPGIGAVASLREALVKSNASLAPIGRNLNQVTRALNVRSGRLSRSDRDTLEQVAQRVLEHLKLVSQLLHAIRAPRAENMG